jgi:hypothetical protein
MIFVSTYLHFPVLAHWDFAAGIWIPELTFENAELAGAWRANLFTPSEIRTTQSEQPAEGNGAAGQTLKSISRYDK